MEQILSIVKFFLLAILLVLFSCERGPLAYGVVVWPPPSAKLDYGDLVWIVNESRLQKTYTVKDDEGNFVSLEQWRLLFFHKQEEAQAFKETFESIKTNFVQSTKQALPVRSLPDNTNGQIVYRLRQNELAKVLQRQNDISVLGNLQGRWYFILTEDGQRGYVFDYYLHEIVDHKQVESSQETNNAEDLLELWSREIWRPAYYQSMAYNNNVVLSQFNLAYGLIFNLRNKSVRITLPSRELNFVYSQTELQQKDLLILHNEESSLSLNSSKPNEIFVSYQNENDHFKEKFIVFPGDIAALRSKRIKSISFLKEELTSKKLIGNATAGTLQFLPQEQVSWTLESPELLNFLGEDFPQGEAVHYNLEKGLHASLQKSYRGVLTLTYHQKERSFLLDLNKDFLQLVVVHPRNIQDGIVQRDTAMLNLEFKRQ